jgi:CBS domain containing-hemolysin-like protein
LCQVNERFDFNVLFRIYRSGHSRIPVYQDNIHNIVGLVFAKDLTLISPDASVPHARLHFVVVVVVVVLSILGLVLRQLMT